MPLYLPAKKTGSTVHVPERIPPDVYKRQVLVRAVPLEIHHAQHVQGIPPLGSWTRQPVFKPLPGRSGITLDAGSVQEHGADNRLPGISGTRFRHGVTPGAVSYTHLDVYKRQAWWWTTPSWWWRR